MSAIRLVGVREIDKVLKGLPNSINHKVLQAAHAEAVKPTVRAAYFAAPLESGDTAESIGVVKTSIKRANTLGEIKAGPRISRRYKGYKAHWFEYGTSGRYNKNGAYRGSIHKKPFMEPAWERTKSSVENSINDILGKKLYQFMKRTIKNA